MRLLLWMTIMVDFICSGFAELWGMGRERKFKVKICLQPELYHQPFAPFESSCFRLPVGIIVASHGI